MIRYRRRRKMVREPINTENTPFLHLPRDLCELMLDILDTRSVFNLMLVSQNTKVIAYSDQHWKKRLYLLFSEGSVNRHLAKRGGSTAAIPYRILAVEMINKKYTEEELVLMLNLWHRNQRTSIVFMDDGIEALNNTVGKYVRSLSMLPLDEFKEIIEDEFRYKFDLGHGDVDIGQQILDTYKFNRSRVGVISHILSALIRLYQYSEWIANDRLDAPTAIFEMTKENVIINLYRLIERIPFVCSRSMKDGEIDPRRQNFYWSIRDIVNIENYPYLADVK